MWKRSLTQIPSTIRNYIKFPLKKDQLSPVVIQQGMDDLAKNIEELQQQLAMNEALQAYMSGHTLQLTSSAILMTQGLLSRAIKCRAALKVVASPDLPESQYDEAISQLSPYWSTDRFEFDFQPPFHLLE
jgi:hypothetical protein